MSDQSSFLKGVRSIKPYNVKIYRAMEMLGVCVIVTGGYRTPLMRFCCTRCKVCQSELICARPTAGAMQNCSAPQQRLLLGLALTVSLELLGHQAQLLRWQNHWLAHSLSPQMNLAAVLNFLNNVESIEQILSTRQNAVVG